LPMTANIHLDFGQEKKNFTKDGENALPYDSSSGKPIIDNTEYKFDAAFGAELLGDLSDAEDSIYNDNIFKKLKGNGGLLKDTNKADDGADDLFVGNVLVKVVNKGNNALVWQGKTDKDGWYYADFFATGKAATYKVIADTNGNGVFDSGDMAKDFTLGGATKYVQTDFFGDLPGGAS